MSHQDFLSSGLSTDTIAVLMSPGTLKKIDGILWPSAGPELLYLSGQASMQKDIYEYVQYGRSCSYVWHPMSAIARMPSDSGQKASILSCLVAELDDMEAVAVGAFMAAAPSLARKIHEQAASAAVKGFLWPEIWDTVACDLWTFLQCGFHASMVRNVDVLDLSEQGEEEIVQLTLDCLNY